MYPTCSDVCGAFFLQDVLRCFRLDSFVWPAGVHKPMIQLCQCYNKVVSKAVIDL
jgi:hypothetical protein